MAPPSAVNDLASYEGHPQLSPLQAQLLDEYAKLNHSLKSLIVSTRELSAASNDTVLEELRALERKMGLVLTLFRASVWSVRTEDEQAQTEEEMSVYDASESSSLRAEEMEEDGEGDGDVTATPGPRYFHGTNVR